MNKIGKFLCMGLHVMGYESLRDLLMTSLALKTKWFDFYSIGFIIAMVATTVAHLTNFTEKYIYSPSAGIAILFGVTIFDFLVGLWYSFEVKKINLNPWRIPRTFARFIVQILLIGFLYKMSELWPYVIQYWIVTGLLIVFILTTIWSIVENAKDLGIITKQQYEFIEGFVNIGKIVNKLKSKNDEEV